MYPWTYVCFSSSQLLLTILSDPLAWYVHNVLRIRGPRPFISTIPQRILEYRKMSHILQQQVAVLVWHQQLPAKAIPHNLSFTSILTAPERWRIGTMQGTCDLKSMHASTGMGNRLPVSGSTYLKLPNWQTIHLVKST